MEIFSKVENKQIISFYFWHKEHSQEDLKSCLQLPTRDSFVNVNVYLSAFIV